jgi:ABC-type uncharacterized transport system auxiliary subunit
MKKLIIVVSLLALILACDDEKKPTTQVSFTSQSSVTAVPEPTTIVLLSLGLVGLAGIRKKFKE